MSFTVFSQFYFRNSNLFSVTLEIVSDIVMDGG